MSKKGESEKSNSTKKEENRFLELVEKYSDVIKEEDLETLMKVHTDLVLKVYLWILTLLTAMISVAATVKIVVDIKNYFGWVSFIAGVVGIPVVLYILIRKVSKIDPLKLQADVMKQYLIAKKRLKDLRRSNAKIT